MKQFISQRLTVFALAVVAAVTLAISVASASKQPHMDDALNSLRAARTALIEATANKGGHRVKALRLVDEAIVEVNKGIESGE